MSDSDGDGLPDEWETKGIDIDGDGLADITLPNANPQHKDIYLQIDWMETAVGVEKVPQQNAFSSASTLWPVFLSPFD